VSGVELVVAAAVVFVAGVVGVVAASLRAGRASNPEASPRTDPAPPPVLWPTSPAAPPSPPSGQPVPSGAHEVDPEATVPPMGPSSLGLEPARTIPYQPPPAPALDPEATVPPETPTDPEDEPTLPPGPDLEGAPKPEHAPGLLEVPQLRPIPEPQAGEEPTAPGVRRPRPFSGADSLAGLPRLGPRVDRVEEPSTPWVRQRSVAPPLPAEPLPVPALPEQVPTFVPEAVAGQLPSAPPAPQPPAFDSPPLDAVPQPARPTRAPGPSILSLLAPPPKGRILRQLPDCLDLVVTCLEGGMAIDLALQRTSQELAPAAPELCAELNRLRADQAAGLPRAEALGRLVRRCPVEPLHEFLAAADQAATVGTEVATGLARQAAALRRAESARVEAWARRLPTAVMLTAFIFLVPPIFVLLLGTSVLQAIRAVGAGL
jgi:hypothetical protein